ncbi:extracellular solute-binding protein [Cohnella faecalis]|uniref:Extracellular solute-binding protein n=1 Tax=Cohnella faecalis TaxID=2315694 RepID=A0A398CN16_9BACL|nr:extracellular solute-binding protein [Cohnella faecalis]RIE03630.1 extracellular solute-binding protein [Cohnella faecalis]
MLKTSKKFGKSSAIMLATAMSFVLILSACGNDKNKTGGNEASPVPPSSESASPTASESSSPDTKLSDYNLTLFLPGTTPKDEQKVEAEINKYLKDKINATLDLRFVDWGQWDNKMNLAIASRDPMDIIFTAAWNGHAANVAKKAFLALNDPNGPKGNLIEQYGQDITATLPEQFLKGAKIDGLNYGIPSNKELAEQGGIIYRKDIADELGLTDKIEAVKTIADLEPILAEVKAKKPDMIPVFMRDGENFNAHYFFQIRLPRRQHDRRRRHEGRHGYDGTGPLRPRATKKRWRLPAIFSKRLH